MKFISILRGINVGGKRKILMRDLTQLFIDLGLQNVKTYIQSGNVVFSSQKQDASLLEIEIEQAIEKKFGFQVLVIVVQKNEFDEIFEGNPFKSENVDHVHLTILKKRPQQNLLEELRAFQITDDTFQIIDRCIYMRCSGKYSDSKLSNAFFEKKLKVSASTRNWKTVIQLFNLMNHI